NIRHRIGSAVRIGDMALHALDVERAGLRAAAADLDGIAEHLDIGGLAEHAMIELFAALRRPLQELDRAVDGYVFLVARDQERDRPSTVLLRLAAVVLEIFEHCGDAAGDTALHVDGAATVEEAVFHLAGERAMRPGGFIARRYHVGMAGK